jgi:hypothetical protein
VCPLSVHGGSTREEEQRGDKHGGINEIYIKHFARKTTWKKHKFAYFSIAASSQKMNVEHAIFALSPRLLHFRGRSNKFLFPSEHCFASLFALSPLAGAVIITHIRNMTKLSSMNPHNGEIFVSRV